MSFLRQRGVLKPYTVSNLYQFCFVCFSGFLFDILELCWNDVVGMRSRLSDKVALLKIFEIEFFRIRVFSKTKNLWKFIWIRLNLSITSIFNFTISLNLLSKANRNRTSFKQSFCNISLSLEFSRIIFRELFE